MKIKMILMIAVPLMIAGLMMSKKTLPRGIRNNNPANIEDNTAFLGMVGSDGRFAIYETPFYGIRAIGRQLKIYRDRDGINTVAGIISKWAPDTENDTLNYIRFVSERAGVLEFSPLSEADYVRVVEAMIMLENGVQPYELAEIQHGTLAGLQS